MFDNGWIKFVNICCFIDFFDVLVLNFFKEIFLKVLGKG